MSRRLGGRIWKGLGLTAIAGALVYLIAGGLRENVVYFLTPSEIHAEGTAVRDRPLRLGGQVKPESVEWDRETRELRFVLTDGGGEIPVHSVGAPPAMFREGIGVVVEGRYRPGGVFESDNVMVKHSNEYAPPEDDASPREAYETLLPD